MGDQLLQRISPLDVLIQVDQASEINTEANPCGEIYAIKTNNLKSHSSDIIIAVCHQVNSGFWQSFPGFSKCIVFRFYTPFFCGCFPGTVKLG